MEENTKKLKPYHGIIMLVLTAISIFFVSPILSIKLGLYGTLLNELLILFLAVAVVLVFRGNMREVFPIQKPRLSHLVGTVLLWLGTFLTVMILTLIITYFFPEQMTGVSQGLGDAFTSVAFVLSFLIVSISPAICEEAVFRGVVLNSFSGLGNKWIAIILSGVIFGAFHGSIWRFVPTAILGIMIGYIVFETGNMLYGCLFHAVNNAVPLVLLFVMQKLYSVTMVEEQMEVMETTGIPLASIGMYCIYGAAIPFLLYIGNYLIHKGQRGIETELFSGKKRSHFVILAICSVAFVVIGFGLIAFSTYSIWLGQEPFVM